MSDALLFAGCFLACWLAAGAAVVVLFSRYKRRRPYLAARLDEKTGTWANDDKHRYDQSDAYVLLALGLHSLGHVLAEVPPAWVKQALRGVEWHNLPAVAR